MSGSDFCMMFNVDLKEKSQLRTLQQKLFLGKMVTFNGARSLTESKVFHFESPTKNSKHQK